MPLYTDTNQIPLPGVEDEECLYPISPKLLPPSSPYIQPHPLTASHLYNNIKYYHSFLMSTPYNPKNKSTGQQMQSHSSNDS